MQTKPVSLLAVTLCPGTQYLEVRFTDAVRDMTLATAGRVLYVDSAGAQHFWALTLSGTPTTREAVMVHAFTGTDLDSTMVGNQLSLRAMCTVAGVEYLDTPDPFLLPVLA